MTEIQTETWIKERHVIIVCDHCSEIIEFIELPQRTYTEIRTIPHKCKEVSTE